MRPLVLVVLLYTAWAPPATAAEADHACDPTGALVCVEVHEDMRLSCALAEGLASCFLYREAGAVGSSPAMLPGRVSVESGGEAKACIERANGTTECGPAQPLLPATFHCEWSAGFSCFVHATILPWSSGQIALAPGECLSASTDTTTVARGSVLLALDALPAAEATASSQLEDSVCA